MSKYWFETDGALTTTSAEPKYATAMEAEVSHATMALFERMHEHLKQDMYRRVALLSHLFNGGLMRVPTGLLTHLPDKQPAPSDRHVEALRYAIKPGWHRIAMEEPRYLGPCECGRALNGTNADRGRKCEVCRETTPKPPTLREWLGDRVSELGPWADVLRERPEPAGHIEELLLNSSTGWLDYLARGEHGVERGSLTQHVVVAAITPQDPFYEALQMALFTRHPDVKPDPKPAAFPWDPEAA